LRQVTDRFEREDLGEPARRRRRAPVVDAELEPRDVDLLVGHVVTLCTPRAEPRGYDAAPCGAALVFATGRDRVLDLHAGSALDRDEAHLGLDVVDGARPAESDAGLPERDPSALEEPAGVHVVEDLEDAPAHAGLTADLDDARGLAVEVDRSAHPPQVHLFGECPEGGGRIHRYCNVGSDHFVSCHCSPST
jgi:hypothetical protein